LYSTTRTNMSAVKATVQAVGAAEDHSSGTMKIENTEKRDALKAIENKYQTLWAEQGKLHCVGKPKNYLLIST
jgi:hypothetical protein